MPFGTERVNEKTGSFETRYTFTDQEDDPESDLLYYGARYYHHRIGRFASQDPLYVASRLNLADPQSLNPYSYSGNNPVRYVDPTGESWRDVVDVTRGYGVGVVQGVGTAATGVVHAVLNPVETVQQIGNIYVEGARAGVELYRDLNNNPGQALSETETGLTIWFDAFSSQSAYDQGKAIGNLFGQIEVGLVGPKVIKGKSPVKSRTEPYTRKEPASIPARGPQRNFTASEREQINQIGRRSGCHTCGTRDPGTKSDNFIPDHQPESALNFNSSPQRLHAQCLHCSHVQGGQVRQQLWRLSE